MKRSYIFMVAAAFVAATLICSLAAAGARHPKGKGDFAKSDAYKKLDLRLAQAWERGMAPGGDPDRALECLVKAESRPTDAERAALSAAGFSYRTVVGTIITGNLKVRSVPEVARLPFVQAMELAVPLNLKVKGDAPTPYK